MEGIYLGGTLVNIRSAQKPIAETAIITVDIIVIFIAMKTLSCFWFWKISSTKSLFFVASLAEDRYIIYRLIAKIRIAQMVYMDVLVIDKPVKPSRKLAFRALVLISLYKIIAASTPIGRCNVLCIIFLRHGNQSGLVREVGLATFNTAAYGL